MNPYKELLTLIDKYNQLLHDHKMSIDMTTKEQYQLLGYDEALQRVVGDITKVINDIELECLAYTE